MAQFVSGFTLSVAIAPAADRADPAVSWTWTDVTNKVRLDDGINIEVGRADERSIVGPGRCTLTFDNRTGDFSRTNPTGAYYGSLTRNTPLRIRVTPDASEVTDAFGRTESSGWGDADTGQAWYTRQNSGTVADFDVTSGAGRHSVQTNVTYRYTYLPAVQLEDANVKITVSCTTPTGGVFEPANILLRGQNVSTYYMCRLTVTQTTNAVTAIIVAVVDGVETTLGSASTGVTHSAGTALNVRAEAAGAVIRMRAWQGGSEPGSWAVSVTDTTIPHAGWVGIRSGVGSGNSNAKPVVYSYDNLTVSGPHDVFMGEVPEWAPRWDKTARNRTVPITAAGILRRLGQNLPPLRSPAYQALTGVDPYRIAHWPLEEESGATMITSPVGSSPPNIQTGTINFGGYTDSPSAERMLVFGSDTDLQFPVPTYSSTETKVIALWHVPDAGMSADTELMRLWCTGGTVGFLSLGLTTAGSLSLSAWNFSTIQVDTTGSVAFGINGRECMISLELTQDGSDLDVRIFVQYADDGSSVMFDDTFGGLTLGSVNYIRHGFGGFFNLDGIAFGHLAVATSTDLGFANFILSSGDTPPGVTGYAGEPAATRIERLCDQAAIPVVVQLGDDDIGSEAMGPQLVASVLDNIRDCETADHGMLYEIGAGLAYQPRSARYTSVDGGTGALVALALDVDSRELGDAPEPVDDDQALANDVTVKRPDGGEARYEATGDYSPTGPIGRYQTQVEVNVESDERLLWHAQWLVGLGTQDDLRWPRIHLQLSANAGLALRWLGTGVGSRITIANPPTGVAPDLLDLFVEGWSCEFGDHQWTVTLNCSTARPYHVIALDGTGNTSRLDTAGSELDTGIDDNDTSLSVATTDGPLWTTASGDRPFDIEVGGECMTVTNVTGGSSPQTFSVTRSVNGVTKAHSAGAAVRLWQPYVLGL